MIPDAELPASETGPDKVHPATASDPGLAGIAGLEDVLKHYETLRLRYDELGRRIKGLLEQLLLENGIRYQTVEARPKSVGSLAGKLLRKGYGGPDPLAEVADLCGVRIILYFKDDVERVCELIEREFQVDQARSSNKADELGPDRFGYVSMHKVVSLSEPRASTHGLSHLRNLFAEIQVRTVMQHAWAAISHALQYKREAEVPISLRRALCRLSALIEQADIEFAHLREEQVAYDSSKCDQLAAKDVQVGIDLTTLREYARSSPQVAELRRIADEEGIGVHKVEEPLPQTTAVCRLVGIETIDQLDRQLSVEAERVHLFFGALIDLYSGKDGRITTGLVGGTDHIVSLLVIGGYWRTIDQTRVVEWLGWRSDYVGAVINAGRFLTDRLQDERVMNLPSREGAVVSVQRADGGGYFVEVWEISGGHQTWRSESVPIRRKAIKVAREIDRKIEEGTWIWPSPTSQPKGNLGDVDSGRA